MVLWLSLEDRSCETGLRPSNLCHAVGRGGGESAGCIVPSAHSPLEVSRGQGAVLLLWEVKGWPWQGGICLTFLSLN